MEPTDKMNKRMHDEGIVNSFGEARRIQHQMPDEETLEKFIQRQKLKKAETVLTSPNVMNCLAKHIASNKGPPGMSIFDKDGNEVFPTPIRPGYL